MSPMNSISENARPSRLHNVPDVIARLKATSFYADDVLLQSPFGPWLDAR